MMGMPRAGSENKNLAAGIIIYMTGIVQPEIQ